MAGLSLTPLEHIVKDPMASLSTISTPRLIESRWPVVLTVIAVSVLISVLPNRIRVFPGWFTYSLAILLLLPMLVLAGSPKPRWLRVETIVTYIVFVVAGLGLVDQIRILLSTMVKHSTEVTGLQLLSSSISVWTTNVLLFSIVYWRTDRGGPEARANQTTQKPDWLFPQETVPEKVPSDWRPTFIDYLFLSFCTATAFSPAEAQPLTSRAMGLLMLESAISLITIIAVASRAINILGN
jgi:hypothetical protein